MLYHVSASLSLAQTISFDVRIHWAFYGEDECYSCNGIDPNKRSNRQKPMGIFRSNKVIIP